MHTILVVDDMGIFRDLISDALGRRGYTCATAEDGVAALAHLKAAPIDLLITDVEMPNMDGLALVRRIRDDAALRALPVIMLTSVRQREQVIEAIRLGIRDYVLKATFTLPTLLSRVEKLIGTPAPAAPPAAPISSLPPAAPPTPAAPISSVSPSANVAPAAGAPISSIAPGANVAPTSAAPISSFTPGANAAPTAGAPISSMAPGANAAPTSATPISSVAPGSAPIAPAAPISSFAATPAVAAPRPAAAAPVPAMPPKPAAPRKAKPAVFLPRLLERDATLSVANDLAADAKSLAGVADEVAKLVGLPDPPTGRIIAALKEEPVFAARCLQRANTMGGESSRERPASLEEAVRRLGDIELRTLAGAAKAYRPMPDNAAGVGLLRAWQHGFAVANILDRLVPTSELIGKGVAHAVGLVHDVAGLLLRQRFPDEIDAAEQYAAQADSSLAAISATTFNLPYVELVAAVLKAMRVPNVVAAPILAFWAAECGQGPQLTLAEPDPAERAATLTLSHGLRVAHQCALALQLGPTADPRVAPLDVGEHRAALLNAEVRRIGELRFETTMTMSGLAGVGEGSKAAAPRFASRDVALAYVRHQSFAAVDPLEVALAGLATTETLADLPRSSALASRRGLVLSTPSIAKLGFSLGDIVHVRRAALCEQLPVLIVTSDDTDPEGELAPNVTAVAGPVKLSRLHDFIKACRTPAAKTSAAA